MAVFNIEDEKCLGFSHCGGVYETGCGEVELTDNEVEQLVSLMRRKNTSDVETMHLKEELPEIYKKLDEVFREIALQVEDEYWLDEGYYHDECHQYEDSDMIAFLKEKDAWDFEYDEEDYKNEDGTFDEDAFFYAECDYLHEEALDSYLSSLVGDERYDFLRNKVGIDVDLGGCEYEIKIPDEIISLAFPEK